MAIDLRDALRVKAEQGHKDLKIGILVKDAEGQCFGYKKGRVVLFKPDADGKTVCVETPMSAEWCEQEKARGSGIRTIGPMVGVPKDFIEEVLV